MHVFGYVLYGCVVLTGLVYACIRVCCALIDCNMLCCSAVLCTVCVLDDGRTLSFDYSIHHIIGAANIADGGVIFVAHWGICYPLLPRF